MVKDFYDTVQSEVDQIPKEEKVLLLGELKARIGQEIMDGIKQKFNEELINRSGEILMEFFANNKLRTTRLISRMRLIKLWENIK